jgi:hypothetical protein
MIDTTEKRGAQMKLSLRTLYVLLGIFAVVLIVGVVLLIISYM